MKVMLKPPSKRSAEPHVLSPRTTPSSNMQRSPAYLIRCNSLSRATCRLSLYVYWHDNIGSEFLHFFKMMSPPKLYDNDGDKNVEV
jgi:hypothetical protein